MKQYRGVLVLGVLVFVFGMSLWTQAQGTLRDVIANEPTLSVFNQALSLVDPQIVSALEKDNNLTVIAPSDSAFSALARFLGIPFSELTSNDVLMNRIISYHIVRGRFTQVQLQNNIGALLPTYLEGAFISVAQKDNGVLAFNNIGEVLKADISASNGVVHIIDDGLLNRIINQTIQELDLGSAGSATNANAEATPASTPEAIGTCRQGYVRVWHLIDENVALDVSHSTETVIRGLASGTVSTYLPITAEDETLVVVPEGVAPENSPHRQAVDLGDDCLMNLIITGQPNNLRLNSVTGNATAPEGDDSRLTVINLSTETVSFAVDGFVKAENLGVGATATFTQPFGIVQPSFVYSTGEPLAMNRVSLWAGSDYLVVLYGDASAPQTRIVGFSAEESLRLSLNR